MKPLVSVIIPTHNRSNLLFRAVQSVLNQTFDDFECIIVNDASTDDTDQVVLKLSDKRIRYLCHEENRHVSAARNTGLATATGELIAFLDDDDVWLPDKLEKQVALMQELEPDYGLVYCWMDIFRGDRKIGEKQPGLRGHIFLQTLTNQPIGNCSTLLARSTVLKDVGCFDETLRRGNDGDFIRRVCRQYKVDFVPEALVNYYVGHPDRITSESLSGIRAARRGEEVKLVKFEKELRSHPQIHATILKKISRHCIRLRDYAAVDELLREMVKIKQFKFPRAVEVFSRFPSLLRNGFYRLYYIFHTIKSKFR